MFRSETFDREEEDFCVRVARGQWSVQEMTIKAEVCHFNLVLFQKVGTGLETTVASKLHFSFLDTCTPFIVF